MKKTYTYAFSAIFFWSTVSVVAKLLLGARNNFQVLWISSLFAAVFLLITNLVTGNIKRLKAYKLKDYVISVLIGLPGAFFYYVFFYGATKRMLASQAFIVNYLWPIMSVFFAFLILKERLSARKCAAFALSFIGVLTVAGNELLSLDGQMILGVCLCVLAAVSYGAFTALNQRSGYDDRISMMISFFASFILSAAINMIIGEELTLGVWQILGAAWNGVAVMALATLTWAAALRLGGTARVSNLAYITPFLSLVWTFFVLHEPIKLLSVIGLGIIILGIFIQMKGKNK